MTIVLIEKGLVLEGWPSNIEVSWVLGIFTFTTTQSLHCTTEEPAAVTRIHPDLMSSAASSCDKQRRTHFM